jgi:glycosyltransferase involved in cell wall biosynthesis
MRVLFLTHYFHPEGNAPGTRVYELCRRWVKMGHDVTVITGVPNVPDGLAYEGYENRWLQRECIDGIETIRVWTYLAANKGTTRRILNYLSLMISATLAGLRVRKPDLVIATSPQFFCGWAGVWVSRLRRTPFILEVRDLWPESIVAVGAMRAGRWLRLLEWFERRMYAAASQIVTVGAGYRDQLTGRGVAAERIDVVPNGVDRNLFNDCGNGPALRRKFELGDAFICSYIGTIGLGSGLEVVLRAARLLRDEGRDDIVFALVGDGAVRESLERKARQEGLEQVVFTGRQEKHTIPDFLSMTDACLVHLVRRDLFRTVLPSKIFEAAAMKKPIILGVEGSAAQIVREANAGICIEPENERELVEVVKRLARDRDLAGRLGQAGFDSIAAVHDYDRLAEKYAEIIERVAAMDQSRLRG